MASEHESAKEAKRRDKKIPELEEGPWVVGIVAIIVTLAGGAFVLWLAWKIMSWLWNNPEILGGLGLIFALAVGYTLYRLYKSA